MNGLKKYFMFAIFAIFSFSLVGCGTINLLDNDQSTVNTDYTSMFLDSRDNTLSANEYKYDYEMNAKVQYNVLGSFGPWVSAITEGSVWWDSEQPETNYMMERNTSGLLLIDGTSYTFNKGNTMITQNLNTDKDFALQESEDIVANYNFESKAFANILNNLQSEDIKSVTSIGNNQYKIIYNSSMSIFNRFLLKIDTVYLSNLISLISNITDNTNGVSFGVSADNSVTIQNNKIIAFNYLVEINVSNFSFILNYTQNYTNIGSGVDIVLPQLNNIYLTQNDIDAELNIINNALQLTKNQEYSKYDYDIKTAVDYGYSLDNILGLAINSHSQGTTTRKIVGEDIYFLNRLELDSDYKNDNDNITDYERYRAVLSDGSVYDAQDRVWPASNLFTELNNYDNYSIDNYYGFVPENIALQSDNIKILQKQNDNGVITYNIGLSKDSIKGILEYFNGVIRLDVDLTELINVYDIGENFNVNKLDFKIVIGLDGKVSSIELSAKGSYIDKNGEPLKWSFENSINYKNISEYTIPIDTGDIDLS